MKPIATSFVFACISLFCFSQSLPVNKNASPEAKELLNFFYSISGKQIISGQHGDVRFLDTVKSITGKYPALWGSDFIWHGAKDAGQNVVNEAMQKYKEGYIITLMWHQGRPNDNPPFGWKESIQGKLSDAQWKELTTPGTALYQRWLARIDVVAGYLQQLDSAHIPILWRPLHEMNGIWFWWGNKPGKDGVQKLWKIMYDRYTNHFHLHNLIWVWGANGPRDIPGDEAYPYKDFYPGSEYVDMLGADVYHLDYEQKDYNELLNLAKEKPIALTEVGELPSVDVLNAQPKWCYFLVWSDWVISHNTRQQVKDVYDRKQTLSLGEATIAKP
ncbi:MAG: glycoside hydrolase family 26 protein [Bacteroidota bacterium]|nr:glycoside hydrolase family 26 protein [Bacteroidota bacterium]